MRRSSLSEKLQAIGARMVPDQGWEIAGDFGSAEREYWAVKKGAGFFDLSHRGRILVRGEDAPRFLHGMVTNDVLGLKPGQGNYAFLLNVQGHILSDAHIFRLDGQSFLIDCESASADMIAQALDRHIIADVVELEDQRERLAVLGIAGPQSRTLVERVLGLIIPEMNSFDHSYIAERNTRIIRISTAGEPGYWLIVSPNDAAALWDAMITAGGQLFSPEAPIGPVGVRALEISRVESGIPRYGADITDKNLPQETGQMQAISFTKGCYIGQEVVERIRSRGHVNRKLVRLVFEEPATVVPQTDISVSNQVVGYVCSSAYSPRLKKTVALGYVRQEKEEPSTEVLVGDRPAKVADVRGDI